MEHALDILTDKLKAAGMNEVDIDHLLARFLEEEALDYVEYIAESIAGNDTPHSELIHSIGFKLLRQEFDQLEENRRKMDLLSTKELGADIEVKCRMILSGLSPEESIDLLRRFLEENIEKYIGQVIDQEKKNSMFS